MTTRHNLYIEECPLENEDPDYLTNCPKQAQAAFDRGARVIGFTEISSSQVALRQQLFDMAAASGYVFYGSAGGWPALAYKASTENPTCSTVVTANGNAYVKIQFDWWSRRITFLATHWLPNTASNAAGRQAMTDSVLAEMQAGQRGTGLAFLGADSNPAKPLRDGGGDPINDLRAGGLLLVNDELNKYPAGLGVTTIMRHSGDLAVTASDCNVYDPLGSDHHPEKAVYSIAEPA